MRASEVRGEDEIMNCNAAQPLLSEYIDNTLSARDTWEVDRHLADCNHCARTLNDLRATVSILADSPRFEVAPDFMLKLSARISQLEPEQPRNLWLTNLRELFRPRVLPAWGAALGACALTVIMFSSRPDANLAEQGSARPVPFAKSARNQSVALAASNPLGDPAAAALMAANSSDSSEASTQ